MSWDFPRWKPWWGPLCWCETTCNADDQTLSLLYPVAVNAVEKIQASGMTEPFTKIIEDPKEVFNEILQRFVSAVTIAISHPETKWMLIKTLPFENFNDNGNLSFKDKSILNLIIIIILG